MFRRARLRQRRVLELAAISTLLAVILMTSMQTLIQIPYYASAQLTPTSLQESGITPITPTTVSSPLGGQPIVPASSDTIDDMTENMTDPLQNTSLSNITQQATIDSALAGHLPVPVSTAGCVSLCAAISDETIGNGGVVGGNGVIVSNGGNVGGDGGGSGGDGDGSNGGGGGAEAMAMVVMAVAVGAEAMAMVVMAVAVGAEAMAMVVMAVAVAAEAMAMVVMAVAVGAEAMAMVVMAVAVGAEAMAMVVMAVAVAAEAMAMVVMAVAVGAEAMAMVVMAVAVGAEAMAMVVMAASG